MIFVVLTFLSLPKGHLVSGIPFQRLPRSLFYNFGSKFQQILDKFRTFCPLTILQKQRVVLSLFADRQFATHMTIDYLSHSSTRKTTNDCNHSSHWKVFTCESHQHNGKLNFLSCKVFVCNIHQRITLFDIWWKKNSTCETNRRHTSFAFDSNFAFAKSNHAHCPRLRTMTSFQLRQSTQHTIWD